MTALRSFATCLAAVTAVLAHEIGSALVRAAEAYGVAPDVVGRRMDADAVPDFLPDWVDDGSASW